MQSLKTIVKSILRPAKAQYHFNILRYFLLLPGIYDLVSFFLQSKDIENQNKIVEKSSSDEYFKKVYDYNANVTVSKGITTTRRPEEYFKFIDALPNRGKEDKILLIGPRNIFELYLAWLYGFKWKNIFAIDLYSTNPKIKVMNMEDMSFEDNSFDFILMSRVYPYSKNPEVCIAESARVLKNSGHLIFEANFFPDDDTWPTNKLNGRLTMEYLKKHRLYVTIYRYTEKINALGKRQGTHKICALKDLNFSDRLDPLVIYS